MDQINRKTCSTDLNDTEWDALVLLLPQTTTGRPREWPLRVMLNAIFYIVRNGCVWRDLPPWKTVYTQFRRWRRDGAWQALNAALVKAVVHSAGIPGSTGGKQTLPTLFERIKGSRYNRHCRLKLIWADGGYEDIVAWVKQHCGWLLEIVRRPEGAKGFVVLPRRWVVERSIAWLTRNRRLSKDYERRTASSEAFIYFASIRQLTKRLAAHA
ncbi:MAG: transposase [Anaerolineales bacterium]|nr:transposase [Anaerolineales bacterium]